MTSETPETFDCASALAEILDTVDHAWNITDADVQSALRVVDLIACHDVSEASATTYQMIDRLRLHKAHVEEVPADLRHLPCNHECAVVAPYGWVPAAGCPVHDREPR